MNAVAYIRVSSTKQLDGDGPERQRTSTTSFSHNRFTIVREFIDDISGTMADRPAFEEMLAYCQEHSIETILIDKTDRFTRDLFVGLQLIATCASRNLNVIDCATGKSITRPSNATEEMVVDMLMVIAKFNKNLLVETMAAARKRIRDSGQKCDGRKGCHDDPNFPQGPAIIARARAMRAAGKSCETIARIFTEENVPSARGGRWHPSTIRRITQRASRRTINAKIE